MLATAGAGFDTIGRLSCCAHAATAAPKSTIATRMHQDESRVEEATVQHSRPLQRRMNGER